MPKKLRVLSPEFTPGGVIPTKYTCEGSNTSPPIVVDNIPSGTKTLALIVEDPDTPSGVFDYWIAWNIPPTGRINEHSNLVEGLNSMAEHNYLPPCPTEGTHTYHFKVYALDTMLNLDPNSGKQGLVKAMRGHTLAKGELQGTSTNPATAKAKAKRVKKKTQTRKTKTQTAKSKSAKSKKMQRTPRTKKTPAAPTVT